MNVLFRLLSPQAEVKLFIAFDRNLRKGPILYHGASELPPCYLGSHSSAAAYIAQMLLVGMSSWKL